MKKEKKRRQGKIKTNKELEKMFEKIKSGRDNGKNKKTVAERVKKKNGQKCLKIKLKKNSVIKKKIKDSTTIAI